MPDTPRITVELLARGDLSLKATLSEAWGKQWQEPMGDTGLGRLTLQNDDSDLALVEYGDLLRFSLDGVPRFLSIVEKKERVDIAGEEEVAEITVVSGRGALAVTEDGVVYPDIYIETVPFADARIFNFSSFFALGPPNNYINNSAGIYDWGVYTSAGPYTNVPTDFPDPTAHWLAPQAPDGGGSHPVGDWYLKTLLVGVDEGQYRLSVSADDSVDIYVDNVPLQKAEGVFGRLITIDLWLDSVLHDISFKVTNLPLPLFGGPTGIIWSLQKMNVDGTVGAVVWHSDPNAYSLDYFSAYPPNPPGFTCGQIITILADVEAQGRGAFPLLTFDFDDDVDSNGVPWADVIQPSFQIGTDLLTVIKQLGETYYTARLDPNTLTLHLYQTLGSASGVTYERGENITELKHQGTI